MARRTTELDDEKRSYSAVFVFGVGFLLAASVWSVWDDNITRRPWKKHQTDFYSLEIDRARAAIRAEEERLAATPEYQALAGQIADLEGRREGGEQAKRRRALEAEAVGARVKASDVDLDLRIVKSKIEEAWYEYDHALLTGQPTGGPKAHLDELEKERLATEDRLRNAEARVDAIAQELVDLDRELLGLREKRSELERERDRLVQRLDGLVVRIGPAQAPKIPKIEQVVLGEFDRSNFNTPLDRVDRCQSCHIAVAKAGFEDQAEPLRSHPHPDILAKHPVEKFGCTPCHQGQGAAVNSPEQAHGEVRHWDAPLLRGAKVQASCIKCHADTRKLPHAQVIGSGQRLFEELGCHGCHLTEGYETLEKVGPSLRLVAAKADPSWLVRWVENPHRYRARTRMPNFLFTERQAVSVAAYLLDSTRAESERWLQEHPAPDGVNPNDPALVAEGKALVDNLGCRACHGMESGEAPALLGDHKDIAPNLANIAAKVDARWMFHWVKDPRGYSSTARMPKLRLSDAEARGIVSFLMTQGRKNEEPALVAKLGDPDTIAAGKALVRKYGCAGCHDVAGMENESRIGVELSAFGSKLLEELFFGNHTDIPFTWDDWTYHKLKDPRTYATERIEQVMPDFALGENDIQALRVFLRSRTDHKIPVKYLADTTPRAQKVLAGRRLAARYNCAGCHVIEDEGGHIRSRYAEQITMAPPSLNGEGSKVQLDWLYGFLKAPVPLRPWLQVRMPTFGFSEKEAAALAEYFAAVDKIETPYVHVVDADIPAEHRDAGQTLASEEYFACFSCHQQGDKKPEGPPEGWAPDLGLARARLNPDWIVRWLRNPQEVQPGTKMPSFYPGGPEDVLDGNEERQIQALRDYIMLLGGRDLRVAEGEKGKRGG